jgi:hypothetical protein
MAIVFNLGKIVHYEFFDIQKGSGPKLRASYSRSEAEDGKVWEEVSGECKFICDDFYALFRDRGEMILRARGNDYILHGPCETSFVIQAPQLQAALTVKTSEFDITIHEPVLDILMIDPCVDELSMQSALWTYSVYSVLKDDNSLSQYWGKAGW